jgi:hypothetical protein
MNDREGYVTVEYGRNIEQDGLREIEIADVVVRPGSQSAARAAAKIPLSDT